MASGFRWDAINGIQKRYPTRRYSDPKLHDLHLIVIDEISIDRRHLSLIVVLDLISGIIVFLLVMEKELTCSFLS